MSNLLQALDPQKLKAFMALYAQGRTPPMVSDETPTAPPPPPTLTGGPGAAQPQPATPTPTQPTPAPQGTNLATPGAISKAVNPPQPDVMGRFREWESSQPQAPNPADYKGSMLRKIFGAGTGFLAGLRNPEAGAEIARDISHPGLTAAQGRFNQATQQWEQRGKNLTQEEALSNIQSEIADREAQAKERQAKATGEEVVPFKLPSGEEIQVRRQDIPHMETAFAAPKLQRAVIDDPANPGNAKAADFDPHSGQYLDPDTHKPIPGAKQFEKPSNQSIEQAYSAAVSAVLAKGQDPAKDAKVQQLAKAYRELHPQNEPGTYIPTYDQKSGALTGAWDPKDNRWHPAPGQMGGSTTGTGLNAADKRQQEQEKEIKPLRDALEEVQMAHTLKDMGDKGNSESDVGLALTFFKVMRGTTGGANIRFTQQENNLIMGARSLWDALEVKGNKVFSHGEPLATGQRQQMLDVIDAFGQATQRKMDDIRQSQPGAQPAPGPAAPTNTKDPAGIF